MGFVFTLAAALCVAGWFAVKADRRVTRLDAERHAGKSKRNA